MEGKTFIFVVFSGLHQDPGLCFLPACFPHVYILVKKAKSWAEAQSYCRLKYTDLATVDNEEEFDKLVATAQGYYGPIWIGLYGDKNSWRWSLEKEGYYGEGEAEFRMWRIGEPNNYGGHENCAQIQGDGLWNDSPCRLLITFVCYNVTSSSFIFVNQYKTWSDAQSYCRQHYTDLASVRNKSENDQIKKMIQYQPTWIGLYRDWKWSDGSPSTFRKWDTAPSVNTPCVCVQQGHWDDQDCYNTFYFVCNVVMWTQQMVRVKMTKKSSSVNLEDAAEAILQQFRQTLKDHGLDEDMVMTWRKQPDGKIFYLEEKEEERKEIGST